MLASLSKNPDVYFIVGASTHFVFWLAHKQLYKKAFLFSAVAISVIFIIVALNMQGIDALQNKVGYAANWLLSPGLFLLTYVIARFLFKAIFKNEPIMAGYMQFSWEQGEYRKLHLGDSLFTVITLFLPMLIPLWI